MKKRFFLLGVVSLFVLSGCDFIDRIFGKKNEPQTEEKEEKYQQEEGAKKDFKQVGEFYGGLVENKKYIGYEFSKSQSEIQKPTSGIGNIDIYAFNDFHGAVVENGSETGLETFGSYLRSKSQNQNTLILDQGDTWQGSLESNYDYGAIVQDVFNYAGVSLRTVGNHDFDWGLDHLESTNNRKLGDDYIPCLAANVYDYANKQAGSTQQIKYGKEYAIFTLDNGIKVGVVGVIGENQITSICSRFVGNICFTNYVEKIKEISDYLRTQKNCDIIIGSAHQAGGSFEGQGLTSISPVSHKRYTDLMVGGHAHSLQEKTENGVKLVQWDSNGRSLGSISLKYDFSTGKLVDSQTAVNTYYRDDMMISTEIDPEISKMMDDYFDRIELNPDEVLSNKFSGTFYDENLAYLMTEAIYDCVKNAGISIDFAVCNYARTVFRGTELTYRDLYKCFPFDNEIMLMDVSSQRGLTSISYNMSYREDTSKSIHSSSTYKVAVVDYVALHQDSEREFDYFPEAASAEVFTLSNGEAPIYREILKDYLKNNPTKQFNASDYTDSNVHFRLD